MGQIYYTIDKANGHDWDLIIDGYDLEVVKEQFEDYLDKRAEEYDGEWVHNKDEFRFFKEINEFERRVEFIDVDYDDRRPWNTEADYHLSRCSGCYECLGV